jgi:glucose-fructose oxidoreductase
MRPNELNRRELLAGLGAVAFAPSNIWIRRQEKPVGWAVLGIGGYAQFEILPAFAHCESSKLVALISGTPGKLARFGDMHGIDEKNRFSYDSMDAIRDHPEIEVVYVITPPSRHPEFTIRAAGLGKHVCSEKPMAPFVAQCQAMIGACRKNRRLLQIGYRSHYEANNLRAMQACRSGELGKLTEVSSDHGFNIGHGQWRTQKAISGGGSMMDIGIYSLQALRYLSGEEPVKVEARIKNPPNDDRFVDCEDDVDFHLTFPSGLVGHGTSGYSWSPGKNQYEVKGTKHTLRAAPATAYQGNHLTLDGASLDVVANNQHAAQIDHLSQCIRRGGRVKTPGEEGLKDIRIIQAIYRSAAEGQPVVLG